jgi:hypothetical protein
MENRAGDGAAETARAHDPVRGPAAHECVRGSSLAGISNIPRTGREVTMATETAPGYRRLKILKRVKYAREELLPGRVVVVDTETATRWLTAKIATGTDEAMPLWTTCPRCQATFPIPATPEGGQFWVQCQNPRCGFGWMR